MSYVPYPSGTMLIPSGPDHHLFIVMTKRCQNSQHLLFSVSSVRPDIRFDDACTFVGGEHEFITHASYIYYRLAELKRADAISKLIDNNYYKARPPLNGDAFDQVCAGVERSKYIKPWAARYFLENRP